MTPGSLLVTALLLAREPGLQPPLGRPSAFGAEQQRVELVPPLTRLYRVADQRSEVIRTFDVETAVTVLEERGPWLRVQSGTSVGWWFREVAGAADGISSDAPPPVDPARRRQRIAAAASLLGAAPSSGETVDWLTDLHPEAELRRRLVAVAACVEERYRRRFVSHLEPPANAPMVVVFAREEEYRRYTEALAELGDLDTGGHAANGVAVLYAGSRLSADVAATLAHELAHLLNARAFPFVLPAWLEEGIAEDFALTAAAGRACSSAGVWPQIERSQREVAGDGQTWIEDRLVASGALRAVACALNRWRRGESTPELSRLVSMSWLEMTAPSTRADRYAAAVSLVRYLLDGAGREVSNEFRQLLEGARSQGALSLRPVLERLGSSWPELDRRVVAFVSRAVDARACELHLAQ